MSIDLYIIGHCLWLNAFVCYAGIWMTGSSYEQERKIDGSKNRHSQVQIMLLVPKCLPLQRTVTEDEYWV
jgi:hypothetical protein